MCLFRGAYKDVSDSRNKLPFVINLSGVICSQGVYTS